MVDDSVVHAVQRYIQALEDHQVDVSFVVVFGSQVRGEADEWSDIDLLVVSPRFDGARSREEVDLLWHLAARTDSRIEPIPCGERQWQHDTSSPIIEVARRYGQRIGLPARV